MKIRKIAFRQSGGFAGLVRSCVMKPDELALGERQALARHTKKAGATAESAAASPARDVIMYEIELETDAGVRRLAFDELNLPADLAKLVRSLEKRSKPGLDR